MLLCLVMALLKPQPHSWAHQMARLFARTHVAFYRLSGGALGGRMAGVPILLLTTVGRKSGRERTLPLLYLETDSGYALVASYGGSDRHPAWYLNLRANSEVEIQVGGKRLQVRAQTVAPQRRAELWPQLVAIYSDYDIYQARTDREIPVVELSPIGGRAQQGARA